MNFKIAKLFDVLSSEVRLCILSNLCLNGEKKVSELQNCTGVSQSVVSQQLAKMKDQKIVTSRKVGNEVFYKIINQDIIKIINYLNIGGK